MGTGKHLATLAFCLALLWASRFGPYACATLPGFAQEISSSWLSLTASGFLLIAFLYVPAYDFVSWLSYRLGWDKDFDPIAIYPEIQRPGQQPISQSTKRFLYPLDLAIVGFVLLPLWTKAARCG
ncbi:MAG TPA: hypothetical protein VF583_08555 [Bradyrhizobium sp.]